MRNSHSAAIFLFVAFIGSLTPGALSADPELTPTQRVSAEQEKVLKEHLHHKMPSLVFRFTPISDELDFIRDVNGITIFVNWHLLETDHIARDTSVTYSAKDVACEDAVKAILEKAPVGLRSQKKLSYCSDGGILYISTVDDVKIYQILWAKHSKLKTDRIEKFPATLPYLELKNNTLSDVIDLLHDATGIKVDCDWDKMQKDGIAKDALVKCRLQAVPTLLAFQLVAQSVSNEKATVDFTIDGGVIRFFSTPVKK